MDIREYLERFASTVAAPRDDREKLADIRVDAVLRLLRGEQLTHVAEELNVPAHTLLSWRDVFLVGGRERLGAVSDDVALSSIPRAVRLRPYRQRIRVIAAGVAAVFVIALVVVATRPPDIREGWITVHDGYGRVGVETTDDGDQVHFLAPNVADDAQDTHAALVASAESYADIDFTLRMRTIEQLRQGSAANPWETGWVVWHYDDDRHFYYLILKPNGWELGKRDPDFEGGQRFLASDKVPIFYFNEWYDVRVVQMGPDIAIWINEQLLTTYTDRESPYRNGRVGMYAEDAYAQFADVKVIEPTQDALVEAGLDR